MRMAVIGLGRLGLPLAALAASRGHDVLGIDRDQNLLGALTSQHNPLKETGLDSLLAECGYCLHFSDRPECSDRDLIFIVVPTPSNAGGGFSSFGVGEVLAHLKVSEKAAVVIVSTVMPGDTDKLAPILSPGTSLCYNPEFVALGSVIQDMLNPDFVLVGAEPGDERGPAVLREFYATLHERPVLVMNRVNAELTKLAINVQLTMRISYANAIARIAEDLPGGNAHAVLKAVGMDSRIGPAYLRAGTPYGGPCFPRDTRAMESLPELGVIQGFIEGIDDVNRLTLTVLSKAILARTSPGSKVAILGMAYKADTDVSEASPGALLAERLEHEGRDLATFDDAQAVVICLPSQMYSVLDYGEKIVIDPWNLLEGHEPKNWVPMGKDRRTWAKFLLLV